MSSQVKIALTSLVLLTAASFLAYKSFNNFKPKNLQPLEEVHGTSSVVGSEIPFPQDYILLGSTQTENSKQITFETAMSAQDIQNFYRNIFTAKGWEIEYDGRAGTFFNTGYKREKDRMKILSSSQDGSGKTIVSAESTSL